MRIVKDIFITVATLIFLVNCDESLKKQQTTVSDNHTVGSNAAAEPKEHVSENTSVKNSNTSQEVMPQTVNAQTQEVHSANSDAHSDQKSTVAGSGNPQPVVPGHENVNQNNVAESKQKESNNVHNLVVASFNIDKTDMVLGNKDSKVVIIEYFSPTCFHCASYHSTIFPEIKQKFIDTNKIAYVIREFIATKQDLDAAILARCKGDVENFMKFQSIILQQQEQWAYSSKYRELLTDIGQLGGVSVEDYKKCLSDDKIAETLIANTNLVGKMPKFMGTPALFINGAPLDLGRNAVDSISTAVEKILA